MTMRLEVVQVPVTDVDRAKAFYADTVGFVLDHDVSPREGMRVVQLTPPGSACSIVLGTGLSQMEPGAVEGLQLVVAGFDDVRAGLIERGAEVGEVTIMAPPGGPDYKFASFRDPDGNGWLLQEDRPGPSSPDPAFAVTGVDFITIPTRDFEKADEFYGDVLGLERSVRWGSMPAGEFETGSLTIAVMQSDAFGQEFQRHSHPVALHVADVGAARAELEARGVTFAADTLDSGVCHMAHFHDPDGNALMLHSRYAPR